MKFEVLEPRRCEDIKAIVAPEIGPKSFGTFDKFTGLETVYVECHNFLYMLAMPNF